MIVWLSDCPDSPGGFGVVTKHMLRALKNAGFRVASVCFGRLTVGEFEGVPVYPFATPARWLLRRIQEDMGEPVEAVVVHGAPWVMPFSQAVRELRGALPGAKLIGYYVHEALFLPPEIQRSFLDVDLLITPTEFTAKVIEPERYGVPYEVVPHGVDPKVWRPLGADKFDRFTIAMVAKNHPRKRWDLFFETVGQLIKRGYDVQALAWVPRKGYWDIEKVLQAVEWRLGVNIPVIMPNPYDATFGLPDDRLAQLLSRAHVHVEMTMGEAWGLPITETLALGVPNLVVAYPAVREWAGRRVSYIPTPERYISVEGLVHPVPSVEATVARFRDMIQDYEKYRSRAEKASRSVRRNLTWKKAGKKMVEALEKHL